MCKETFIYTGVWEDTKIFKTKDECMGKNMKNSKIYVAPLVDLNQNIESAEKDNISKNINLDKDVDK
ncbi:MAG: hypothetical protein ACP5U0_10300 [Caldisphaera sp.]